MGAPVKLAEEIAAAKAEQIVAAVVKEETVEKKEVEVISMEEAADACLSDTTISDLGSLDSPVEESDDNNSSDLEDEKDDSALEEEKVKIPEKDDKITSDTKSTVEKDSNVINH